VRLDWLADVLRARGLVVVEVDGWKSRGHDMTTVQGVVCHHTAGPAAGECPSLHTVISGRPDLPGPLAQILLGRSGACYVVAAGKANHAGAGAWPGVTQGNAGLIGIEAENTGVGQPWPSGQIAAYALLCAALADHCGLPSGRVLGHYEWATPQGRKLDPAGPWLGGGDWYSGGVWQSGARSATCDDFRHRVQLILDSWSDDMTPDEHKLLVQAAADAAYSRHVLDDVIRPKLDAVYVDTHADDHPELLAGRVKALVDGSKP
jgi:hypothetical protein